jgi:P-type Ca2+ transporter type 2C
VALTPLMILFLNFFVVLFPVIVIMQEPPGEGTMLRPPRDPRLKLANPVSVREWIIYGGALFLVTLTALVLGPGDLMGEQASVPMTMAFVVMSFGTILSGLVLRRSPESGLAAPLLGAVKTLSIPVLITIVAVEWTFMQRLLATTSLTGGQWLACLALALVVPAVIELTKVRGRRRLAVERARRGVDPVAAVTPARAISHRGGAPAREASATITT